MAKPLVHTDLTPLHLAFSCHVVDRRGAVLLTRRSDRKRTWPGVWSNACCGHPRLNETLREAVERHVRSELGVGVARMTMAIDDFTYRAQMANRIVEHELCPVVVAEIDGCPILNPDESDAAEWVDWAAVRERAEFRSHTLSPWVVEQIGRLPRTASELVALLDRDGAAGTRGLDDRIELALDPAARATDGRRTVSAGTLDAVVEEVDRELDAFVEGRQRALAAIDPAAGDLGTAIRSLLDAGGKRLRPAFVHWGFRAARAHRAVGGPDEALRASRVAGAAIELLHTFALLHDDVMDRSATRRGRPSAHVAFAESARARHQDGDVDLFGTNAAILAGDLAFVWAGQLFDTLDLAPADRNAARATFDLLCTEVIAGQFLDLSSGGAVPNTAERALRVALLKSARYTVTRPLQLGAAIGGRPVPALDVYGDAVGLAFQLRDDVLDLFGDPSRTGKPRCHDIREGKRTVLMGRALHLATARDRGRLLHALGNADLTDDEAERCCAIVARSGALASVERLIEAQREIALSALLAVDDRASRAALTELAVMSLDRTC